MSVMREQLQRDRAAYRNVRYPGNLAADVLPAARWATGVRWAAGGAMLAATFAIAVWSNRATDDTTRPVAITPVSATPARPDSADTGMPAFPPEIRLVPEHEAISFPSMPAFPSMNAASRENTATTQESV